MNVLIIGNGFDIAHGLRTQYKDFLDYISECRNRIEELEQMTVSTDALFISELWKIDAYIYPYYDYFLEFFRFIRKENFWIEYFNSRKDSLPNTWTGFETDIREVIENVTQCISYSGVRFNSKQGISCKIISTYSEFFYENEKSKLIDNTYDNVHRVLLNDLNSLIRGFELYLTLEVEPSICNIKRISPDINSLSIDHVISYNYTHTYTQIYDPNLNSQRCKFVHGEAVLENGLLNNNMVLGIKEFLNETEKDENVAFIEFRKFFQRIYKATDSSYFDIVHKIETDYEFDNYGVDQIDEIEKSHIYIFGHSLDKTDEDLLKLFLLNEYADCTIFYHNTEQFSQQISNLVKILGQDELINRTRGSNPNIIFKKQSDFVPINS
ncbi:MAG: hypothetical protein J1G06_06120 [Oscillospiraceae bacterium]|nr:hypothetical protein [Oscillospiraceae bacterium]